jgi:hypothetical protein
MQNLRTPAHLVWKTIACHCSAVTIELMRFLLSARKAKKIYRQHSIKQAAGVSWTLIDDATGPHMLLRCGGEWQLLEIRS